MIGPCFDTIKGPPEKEADYLFNERSRTDRGNRDDKSCGCEMARHSVVFGETRKTPGESNENDVAVKFPIRYGMYSPSSMCIARRAGRDDSQEGS